MKIFTRGWSIALVAIIATFVGSGVSAGPPSGQCDFTGTYPDIPGGGFYARLDLTTWQKLHPSMTPTAQAVADLDASGTADVIATFTGLGTWKSVDGGAWEIITPSEASWYAVGDLNNNAHDDLIMAFEGVAGTWKYMGGTSTLEQFGSLTAVRGTTADLDGDGTYEGILVYEEADPGLNGLYEWDEPTNAFYKTLNNTPETLVGAGDLNGSGGGEGNAVMTFDDPTGTWLYQGSVPYFTKFSNLTGSAVTTGDILDTGSDQIVFATDQDIPGSDPAENIKGTWVMTDWVTYAWRKIYNEAATVMNGNCNLDNTGGDDIAINFAPNFNGTWVYLNDTSYAWQTDENATTLAVGVLD